VARCRAVRYCSRDREPEQREHDGHCDASDLHSHIQ
jgi:hypothetical protein